MIGTLTNTICIAVGSLLGALLRKGINDKYRSSLFNAMGLVCIVLGVSTAARNMPQSEYPVLFIVALALGGLIGSALDLDGRVNRFVARRTSEGLAQGLITGCLLYCIGSLSIVGPMLSALYGDNTFLFANSTLDLVTSTVLSTTYGIGMMLAAPVLFCWQGAIYLLTTIAGPVLSDALIAEISIVGGVLILCSGLSILNIKDCKTLNLLPSLIVPPIWFAIVHLLKML